MDIKKLNKIDKMLKILASFLFAFIVTTIIIYTYKGWPYDTLITAVLGSSGIEAIIMGFIKIVNVVKEIMMIRSGDITGFDDAEVVDTEEEEEEDNGVVG